MVSPVEVAKEEPSTIQTFLEKMSVAVEGGRDAAEYVKTEAVTLTRNQWQALDNRVRENIGLPDFLTNQANRDAILAFTSSQLSSFKDQVSSYIAAIPPIPPQVKKTAIIGGISAAAAGVVTAVGYGIYRFFRRAKDVVDTGIEKTKKGLSRMTKILLLGGTLIVAGTALYFGADKIGTVWATYAEKLKEDTKKAASDKAKAVVDETKKTVSDARESVANAVTGVPGVDATEQPEPSQESKSTEKVPVSEKVPESVTAVGELGAESLAGRYLSHFGDDSGIKWPDGKTSADYEKAVIGVLNSFMSNDSLTMATLFSCMNFGTIDDEAILRVYQPPVPSEHPEYVGYLRSAELVIRECVKRKADIAKESEVPVETMTPREFIQEIAEQNKTLLLFQDIVKKHGIDNLTTENVEEVFASVGSSAEVVANYIESMKQHSLYSTLQQKDEEYFKDFSLTKALSLLTSLKINPEIPVSEVRKRLGELQAKTDLNDEEKIAIIAASVIVGQLPTEEELQPFFGGIFPNDEWVDPNTGETISANNKEVIGKYLNHRMTFHEAARLFAYKKMIVNDNPVGALLMIADILRFSRKEEPGAIMGVLKTRTWRAGIRLGKGAYDERFLSALEETFHLSPEMRKRIGKTISTVAPTLVKSALQSSLVVLGAPLEPAIALALEHPIIATAGAAYLARKPVIAISDFHTARTDPTQLVHVLENRSLKNVRNNLSAVFRMRHAPKLYHEACEMLKAINADIVTLKRIDNLSNIGSTIEAAFKRCIVDGATDAHFIEYLDIVDGEVHRARALNATQTELDFLNGLQMRSKALTNATSKEARVVIQVASHPWRGRIVSHGIPGMIEILGFYAALKHDIPAYNHYRDAAEEAEGKGQHEYADFLDLQRKKTLYFDIPVDLGSGIAYYLLQKKVAEMSVSRTGFQIFKGVSTATRAGAVGTMGVTLAIEALRMEAQHIWDSLEENMKDISITKEDVKNMSKKDIENKLTEYSGGARSSWGQWHRYYSFSRYIKDDTWEELERESETVRSGYMYGYLFHRFLSTAREGDISSVLIAHQIFNEDCTEKKEGAMLMQNYMTFCKQYLQQTYGTEDDIKKISEQAGLEYALRRADLAAKMQIDIAACRKSLKLCENLHTEAVTLLGEIAEIEQRIATPDKEGSVEALTVERDEKTKRFDALNADFVQHADIVQGYEMFTLELPDGSRKSILDFAMKESPSGDPLPPDLVHDIVPYVQAYADMKSAMTQELSDPVRSYTTCITRAKEIYSEIEGVNRLMPRGGTWGYTPEHYDLLLSYAHLLDVHPEFDEAGTIRGKIGNLPGIGWQQYPGTHPYEQMFDEVRDMIKNHITHLDALKYKYAPPLKEKDQEHFRSSVVGQENPLERYNDMIILTLPDGQELVLQGEEGQEKKFETSLGTFICRPNAKNLFGEVQPYSWFVIPKDEGQFYVQEKNAQGISQPRESMRAERSRDITLRMQDGGSFFYPHLSFDVTLHFDDGNDLVLKMPKDLVHLKKFGNVKSVGRSTYTDYEWQNGKIEKVEKKDGIGWLIKITSQKVERLEVFSSDSRIPGQKTIMNIEKVSESGT